MKKKANKYWMWLAMAAITRQSLALPVGERRRDRAKELWAKLPWVDREQATFHTDHYDAYTGVMPAERPKASTKQARQPKHIEGFHTTLRQGASRLVRATLAFANKLAHHIGAVKYGICHYNLTRTRAAALPG